MQRASGPPTDRAAVLALVVLCAALYFLGLGSRALWDQDEGMHAATAREMVETGDWLTPRFNGEPFYDKPVLFTWASALSMSLLGYTAFAARLPAAVFGLATVLVTFALGRRMFGVRAAFLGAAVLATSAMVVILSTVVVHDIALTFCTTLALALFWRGLESERHRTGLLLGFWAASGLAVVAKGPVGLLPGFVVGLFLVVTGRLGFVRQMRVLPGIAVLAAVAAPWYVLVAIANPDFVAYFTGKMTGSLGDADHWKAKPFWWYVPFLLGGLLPWTVFLPSALWRAAKERAGRDGPARVFLLLWLGAPLAVFSAAAVKLPTYILPVFPAAALLVGRTLADLWTPPDRALRREVVGATALLFTATLVAPAVLVTVVAPSGELERSGIGLGQALAASAGLVVGSGAALALLLRGRWAGFVAACLATVTGAVVFFLAFLAPAFDLHRSTERVGARLDALLAPGEPMTMYRKLVGIGDSALFYSGRRGVALPHPEDLERFLDSPDRVYCLIAERYWEGLDPSLRERAVVVHQEGNKLILSNR